MLITDNEIAQRFLNESRLSSVMWETLPSGSINSAVREWVIGKYSEYAGAVNAARSLGLTTKPETLDDYSYWFDVLSRVQRISAAVRDILGIDERETVAEIENMNMAEYSKARKNLGVRDLVNYERTV